MTDIPEQLKAFLESFTAARHGTIAPKGTRVEISLPKPVAHQLGFGQIVHISLEEKQDLQKWKDYSTLRRLLEQESLELPKLFRSRYRKSDSPQVAFSFFRRAVKGFSGKLSELEFLDCEVVRCAFKVAFQGEGLVEKLYVGLMIPLLGLCRIEHDPVSLQVPLLAPFSKSSLLPASINWALHAMLLLLEEEPSLYTQYEKMLKGLLSEFNLEASQIRDYYEELIKNNSETQGIEPETGSPQDKLHRERDLLINSLNDRYALQVRFEPVTLALLSTSLFIFQKNLWKIAKLPFSDRLFSTGCSGCHRMLDLYSLHQDGIYCAICKPQSKH